MKKKMSYRFFLKISEKPQSTILTPPNGVSPRKLHKKFGKFLPPPSAIKKPDLSNGLSETESPAKECPSTPGKILNDVVLSSSGQFLDILCHFISFSYW